MRLYLILAFLIVCIIAVNAAQQNSNHANKRNQIIKKKSTNGAAIANRKNTVARSRSSSKSTRAKTRKVKPALARKPKKVVRRVVKKSNRRSGAKKIARKNGRGAVRRNSPRRRLAKQELSDTSENKSIGAGQASGGDVEAGSADKPVDPVITKPVAAPAQPAAVQPAVQPAVAAPAQPAAAQPAAINPLSAPTDGKNPLSSSPFNLPKANGQNQAIGAAFSQSSNGGSAFAAGFASIGGKQNTAGGLGQVSSGKSSNPNSENLNTAEEPAASDTGADETGEQLAAFRRRPRG